MRSKARPEDERFWDSVGFSPAVMSGCWRWLRAHDQDGYGLFKRGSEGGRKMVRAHRFALGLMGRHVPSNMQVLHSCNNTECVNPAHLRIGTGSDNMSDRMDAGHYSSGIKHANVSLSWEQVNEIRSDRRSYSEIASSFGICRNTVWKIKSVKSHWSWRQEI